MRAARQIERSRQIRRCVFVLLQEKDCAADRHGNHGADQDFSREHDDPALFKIP
jgi:hypothetical protein